MIQQYRVGYDSKAKSKQILQDGKENGYATGDTE